jgi:hypothetical protein
MTRFAGPWSHYHSNKISSSAPHDPQYAASRFRYRFIVAEAVYPVSFNERLWRGFGVAVYKTMLS